MDEAFHIIPSASETPLFFFGDHASRHIPDRYDNLGLTGDDLTRHIAKQGVLAAGCVNPLLHA
jgi:predicted N-formylglutamate amidohydrolase